MGGVKTEVILYHDKKILISIIDSFNPNKLKLRGVLKERIKALVL